MNAVHAAQAPAPIPARGDAAPERRRLLRPVLLSAMVLVLLGVAVRPTPASAAPVPLTDVVSAGDWHTLQPAPAIIELLLGQSAVARPSCERPLLDFRVVRLDAEGRPVSDAEGRPEWEPAVAMGEDGQQHHLSSAHFRPTVFVTEDGAGLPAVVFEFTDEGSALFAEITARLSDRSLPLGIFVEDELVAAPVVRSAIRDRGIISGLSVDEAQRLADRLNADAMRCPGEPHQPR